MTYSAKSLASLPETKRTEIIQSLTQSELEALRRSWRFWARDEQLPPTGDWTVWLILAGRGFGKTRSGAEWALEQVQSGKSRIALAGRTSADVRDTMVHGESGIMACASKRMRPVHLPSKRCLKFPNGAHAMLLSADEPDLFRGPQFEAAWADELAAWRYAEAWDNLLFGLRLGDNPRACVTTTPRPTPLVRTLMSDPATVVTRGSTYDNRANLPQSYLAAIARRFEGTRLGRQELHAEVLDDNPGALWRLADIEALRVQRLPLLRRIVVAIDPAVTSNEDSDETGIVVAGVDENDHGYVLDDLSGRFSPDAWARCAINAYHSQRADRIVAEVNNGGDLVETTIRTVDRNVPYRAVHASRGKRVRAEPIAALYEQKRVHHVGMFAALEDQMSHWDASTGAKSPDRLDALVWALTELMVDGDGPANYDKRYDALLPTLRY